MVLTDFVTEQDPIEISSDEDVGEGKAAKEANAAPQATRHSTRSTRYKTTTERFEVRFSLSPPLLQAPAPVAPSASGSLLVGKAIYAHCLQ